MNKVIKWGGILLLLTALLASCKPSGPTPTPTLPGESLEWEKIASRDFASDYEQAVPTMRIATTLEQVSEFEDLLLLSHLESVHNTDFGTYFIIAIFQGEKGSTGYSIEVEDVRRDENVITVYVEFLTPGPDVATGQLVTSPYYVLKVKKTRELEGYFTFVLVANDKELARQPHSIP